ncbi:MAG: NusG domain II-containing protein [Cloacibacillus sp.]
MAIVTAAGALMLICGAFLPCVRGGVPTYAEVVADGVVIHRIPLAQPPRDIRVKTGGGFNIIRAGGGGAAIISADCPDGSCVRMGRITRPGTGAVCLPHHLALRITGAQKTNNDVDGVSY